MMKKDNILKVIAAALSAVLVTPFTLLFTWRKKKPEDSSESRKNKTVDELIAKYGDPDDIILLDASRGNEADSVVLVYDSTMIINGEKINKSDISEVTFKNAAIAYLPDDYQVILISKNPKIPQIQLHVGYERKWAMKIVEQLQHHVSPA
jgi:mannitol-specific phosphotransferase system IIBC component